MRNHRLIALGAAVAVLAGCAQMSLPRLPGGTAPSSPSSPYGQEPQPASAPPAAPVAPAPVVVTPAMASQAQKSALAAQGMLELGQEEQAREELHRALASDPNNKLALNLLRQITSDPVALLGRESFSYTVRPNDSMSSLAQRFLGDVHSFYALARYNNIAVPKQLAGGQVLRIPGKAPPPSALAPRDPPKPEPVAAPLPAAPTAAIAAAPREPTPGERSMQAAEAAERRGDIEGALAQYRKAEALEQPGAAAKITQLSTRLVQQHSLSARTAFARQDLEGAIRAWDKVLSIDPNNGQARFERQRAMELKEKVKKL